MNRLIVIILILCVSCSSKKSYSYVETSEVLNSENKWVLKTEEPVIINSRNANEAFVEAATKYFISQKAVNIIKWKSGNHFNTPIEFKLFDDVSTEINLEEKDSVSLEKIEKARIKIFRIRDSSYFKLISPDIFQSPLEEIEEIKLFSTPWRSPENEEFLLYGKIIVQNNIVGCGEYYIKDSKLGKVIIACSKDGRNWNYYESYPEVSKISEMTRESSKKISPPR